MNATITRIAAVAALALASVATPALAAPVHQYTPAKGVTCRTHYRKHIRNHRRVCIRVAAPKAVVLAPVLAAQLDPSFTQDASNPLLVTYAYSASATINGAPDPTLPAGVLNLYSDGLLACSITVGGTVNGGACPVTYGAYGTHVVVVTYTSGVLSTTQTDTENIPAPPAPPLPPPPPVVPPLPATSTSLSLFPVGDGHGLTFDAFTIDDTTFSSFPAPVQIVDTTTGATVLTFTQGCDAYITSVGTRYLMVGDNVIGNACPFGAGVDVGPRTDNYGAQSYFSGSATLAASSSAILPLT